VALPVSRCLHPVSGTTFKPLAQPRDQLPEPETRYLGEYNVYLRRNLTSGPTMLPIPFVPDLRCFGTLQKEAHGHGGLRWKTSERLHVRQDYLCNGPQTQAHRAGMRDFGRLCGLQGKMPQIRALDPRYSLQNAGRPQATLWP
jgi:hypothetical protein